MSKNVKSRQSANLATPTDLGANATRDLSGGLNILLGGIAWVALVLVNWGVSFFVV